MVSFASYSALFLAEHQFQSIVVEQRIPSHRLFFNVMNPLHNLRAMMKIKASTDRSGYALIRFATFSSRRNLSDANVFVGPLH
jgi:hypothetical protein